MDKPDPRGPTGRVSSPPTTNESNGDGAKPLDPMTALTINDYAMNQLASRDRMLNAWLDPRRNIDDECGYAATTEIVAHDYKRMYDREAIATRVVQVMPKESWQVAPEVFETEDPEDVTEFETAWDTLATNLRGPSWYADQEGSPIWEALRRADEVSGIGHYGTLFIGINDGKDPREPAETKRKGTKITFLRPYDESNSQITAYEPNKQDPRFGMPTKYLLTFNDLEDIPAGVNVGVSSTAEVHWSRIIHLADNLGTNELFGVPRQQPCWNRLMDLRKLYGGSAEMYWKGALPGIGFEISPDAAAMGAEPDIAGMQESAERYFNTLQRSLIGEGVTFKSLSPQVVDPAKQIEVQIEAICILLGIPKRIFMGSERGELASGQDDSTWTDRVQARNTGYVLPRIIVPFVDRCIMIGALPEPKEGYHIKWPVPDTQKPIEKADLAVKEVDALTKYVTGGIDGLVQPIDFLTRFLGKSEEEAQAIIENSMEALQAEQAGDTPEARGRLLELVGGIGGMAELFQQYADGIITRETLKQQLILLFEISGDQAEMLIADTQGGTTPDPEAKAPFGGPILPQEEGTEEPEE